MEDSPLLQIVKRSLDEPKLKMGDFITLKGGEVGVVVARYKPSGHPNEVRYVVRVESANRKRRL